MITQSEHATDTGFEQLLPGLHAAPPERLPFGRALDLRAFLLAREQGNLLVYRSAALEQLAGAVEALGGVERQYLNHVHEAGATNDWVDDRFGAPLYVHAADADEVARHARVGSTFTERHLLDEDFEVIPTPGHVAGSTAFLWDSGSHRVLFTGDTLYVRDGEWRAALLEGVSRREPYVDSLELLAGLDFDVLVPGIATEGEPPLAHVGPGEGRRRIGEVVARLRAGEDH